MRLLSLEHSIYEMQNRMLRWEETNYMLSSRCQALAECLVRCHQWTNSISQVLLTMNQDRDSALYRDGMSPQCIDINTLTNSSIVSEMQQDIERHLDSTRALETPHESLLASRQQAFFGNVAEPGPPLSPRQMPQDDSRRPSLADTSKPLRTHISQHLAVSPRRYGSIGGGHSSPGYSRPPLPQQQQQPPLPPPLSTVTSPSDSAMLARRHTSADIRQHGWLPSGIQTAGNSSGPWPSSPHRLPSTSEQQVRDVLAQYEITGSRRRTQLSRQATPPLGPPDQPGPPPLSASASQQHLTVDPTWSAGSSSNGGPRFPRYDSSLPATRRSSMASNVHSLLNPTDTSERPEEDDQILEDRKRKRLQ